MKNLILCEGSTDGILLQYFMREVHHWEDAAGQRRLFENHWEDYIGTQSEFQKLAHLNAE